MYIRVCVDICVYIYLQLDLLASPSENVGSLAVD